VIARAPPTDRDEATSRIGVRDLAARDRAVLTTRVGRRGPNRRIRRSTGR
jgi:hypothetical protein